ncbi:prion-inhibition and propagation-domain-containing protein [Xylaria telfairii]|nr:prion-inhibition and propagation-domain-containing protein [Xylaria telfairii]
MADPLSVLGAAIGVTSLIMQITDECIKGFKVYNDAVNMPESYRFLQIRIQLEQQRFLNFGLEAGILYEDGELCATLHVNRSLLLGVLAEIKTLMERYAAANGKYKHFMAQENVDWNDNKEPEFDIMNLLFLPGDEKQAEEISKGDKNQPSTRLHKLGKGIARTGRNFRTIISERKRLEWATIDKDSFEQLVSKLGDLNSFLIALLDSAQLQRLQDSMSTTYSAILQIRNDLGSLTTLVKALTPIAETRKKSSVENDGLGNHPLSQIAAAETDAEKKKKQHLKQLVEIKMKFIRMDQPSGEAAVHLERTDFLIPPLPLNKFTFAQGTLQFEELQQRTRATYRGSSIVWVEWMSALPTNGVDQSTLEHEVRISLLTDLLRDVKPTGFRAPPCLGYVKAVDYDTGTRFGIVFDTVAAHGVQSEFVTLRELLGRRPKPSLNLRVLLCAVLAQCVHTFHSVNWLHKGLRSDNVLFFASSSGSVDLDSPYVSGFELSRPSPIESMTEKPGFDPSKDIYRHPNAQSSQMDGHYRKCYDLYSLGVVLIEIALWKPIEEIVGFENLRKAKPSALQDMQAWLLGRPRTSKVTLPSISIDAGPCLQQLESTCGEAFRNIVKRCLTADEIETAQYLGESGSAVAVRLQKITEQDVAKKLEDLARALQEPF